MVIFTKQSALVIVILNMIGHPAPVHAAVVLAKDAAARLDRPLKTTHPEGEARDRTQRRTGRSRRAGVHRPWAAACRGPRRRMARSAMLAIPALAVLLGAYAAPGTAGAAQAAVRAATVTPSVAGVAWHKINLLHGWHAAAARVRHA